MFVLSLVEDDIRVEPRDLAKSTLDAVTAVIEARFVDRVVPRLGLAVSVYDVRSIEGGHVYPNDGAAHFKVRFRLAVFRPFVGEVLVGRLVSSSPQGLRLSLGNFFEDVVVPGHALQDPSTFNEAEGVWVWHFGDQDMFMDVGEEVRFKVAEVRLGAPPTPAELRQRAAEAAAAGDEAAALAGTAAHPLALMEIVGDINGDGLGCTCWWAPPPPGEDAEGG